MAAHDLSFTNARNQKLYASCVVPKQQQDIKAAMVFCHGYAEHSHRKMSGDLNTQHMLSSTCVTDGNAAVLLCMWPI
jgi:cephalosporin-C deacetylase-like acetyl esterase